MLVVSGHLGGLVFIMSRKIAGSALCGGGFFVENAPEMQKFEVTALKCAAMRCGIGFGEWRFGCPADSRGQGLGPLVPITRCQSQCLDYHGPAELMT